MGTLQEAEALRSLGQAFDFGINSAETAISCADSKVRIGRALKRGYRERHGGPTRR